MREPVSRSLSSQASSPALGCATGGLCPHAGTAARKPSIARTLTTAVYAAVRPIPRVSLGGRVGGCVGGCVEVDRRDAIEPDQLAAVDDQIALAVAAPGGAEVERQRRR